MWIAKCVRSRDQVQPDWRRQVDHFRRGLWSRQAQRPCRIIQMCCQCLVRFAHYLRAPCHAFQSPAEQPSHCGSSVWWLVGCRSGCGLRVIYAMSSRSIRIRANLYQLSHGRIFWRGSLNWVLDVSRRHGQQRCRTFSVCAVPARPVLSQCGHRM